MLGTVESTVIVVPYVTEHVLVLSGPFICLPPYLPLRLQFIVDDLVAAAT